MRIKSRRKSVIWYAGAFVMILMLTGIVLPGRMTEADAANKTSYKRIATFQTESAINEKESYIITYNAYLSNTIYYNVGIAMVFDPITYNARDEVSYSMAHTVTKTYSISSVVSETASAKLSANLGIEAEGLKAGIGSELSSSITITNASEFSKTCTITSGRTGKLEKQNFDGVWGGIYKAQKAKFLVVKATVYRKFLVGKDTWNTELKYEDLEVYAEMVADPDKPEYYTDIKVWNSVDEYYDDLDNSKIKPSTEISFC